MEQLERAERYLTRLCYAYEGIQEPSAIFSIEDPKDDCISFFMHCYHIKDWVKEIYCKTLFEKNEVEAFINANTELKICADICNGSKHYVLKKEPRSGDAQKVEITDYNPVTHLTGSGSLEIHKCVFSVESQDGSHDALVLANRCMELWREYLEGKNA